MISSESFLTVHLLMPEKARFGVTQAQACSSLHEGQLFQKSEDRDSTQNMFPNYSAGT